MDNNRLMASDINNNPKNHDIVVESSINIGASNKNCFVRTLLDTIPSPIFYKDIHGVYKDCNDVFSQMILGIPKEDIINKSLFDLPDVIPAELAKIYHEKDQMLFDNPGTQVYQNEVKCADGKIRVFSFHKATVVDEAGDVIGLTGVMLDVTQLEYQKKELDEKNQQLEVLSHTDPLTGLLNRRKLDVSFESNLRIARRHRLFLNFAMLDVDNFKLFNDTYGHFEGDNVLIKIANTLSESMMRADDHAFRVGGEEFGLLYFSKEKKAGLKFAESIREEIQNLEIEHANNEDCNVVTASMGIVTITSDIDDLTVLYKKADQLLYRAKKQGKNKVVSEIL